MNEINFNMLHFKFLAPKTLSKYFIVSFSVCREQRCSDSTAQLTEPEVQVSDDSEDCLCALAS